MSDGFLTELRGLDNVDKALAPFQGPELQAKLRKGMSAAGREFRKSIKAAAPSSVKSGVRPGFGKNSGHKQGDLYRSIRYRTLRGSPLAGVVGPLSPMRHLAIRKTKPHLIQPANSAALAIAAGKLAEIAHHPGNKPHPWVSAGLAAGRRAALEAARDAIFKATGFAPEGDE